MKKNLVYLFAIMLMAIAFTGCKSNEAEDTLNGTTWVAKLAANDVATFTFSSSTFSFKEENTAMDESVILKGTYTKNGNSVKLNFTSASENVDFFEMATTATINGNTLVYGGVSFTKQ